MGEPWGGGPQSRMLASSSAGRDQQGRCPAVRQRRSATRKLLVWLTRRCFVCGRLLIVHSVDEQAHCEFTPLPIQLPERQDDQAAAW